MECDDGGAIERDAARRAVVQRLESLRAAGVMQMPRARRGRGAERGGGGP